MAHFARIEANAVVEVVVVNNDAIDGGRYPESETLGQALLAQSGIPGEWLQCSYSGAFRGCYPSAGWTYDVENDMFVPPLDVPEQGELARPSR